MGFFSGCSRGQWLYLLPEEGGHQPSGGSRREVQEYSDRAIEAQLEPTFRGGNHWQNYILFQSLVNYRMLWTLPWVLLLWEHWKVVVARVCLIFFFFNVWKEGQFWNWDYFPWSVPLHFGLRPISSLLFSFFWKRGGYGIFYFFLTTFWKDWE